jgi:hypothetical protein
MCSGHPPGVQCSTPPNQRPSTPLENPSNPSLLRFYGSSSLRPQPIQPAGPSIRPGNFYSHLTGYRRPQEPPATPQSGPSQSNGNPSTPSLASNHPPPHTLADDLDGLDEAPDLPRIALIDSTGTVVNAPTRGTKRAATAAVVGGARQPSRRKKQRTDKAPSTSTNTPAAHGVGPSNAQPSPRVFSASVLQPSHVFTHANALIRPKGRKKPSRTDATDCYYFLLPVASMEEPDSLPEADEGEREYCKPENCDYVACRMCL